MEINQTSELEYRENIKQIIHPKFKIKIYVDLLKSQQNLPYNKYLTIKNSEV